VLTIGCDASDCACYAETAVGTFKVKLPSRLFEVTTAKSLDPLADVVFVHSFSLRRRHTSEWRFAQAKPFVFISYLLVSRKSCTYRFGTLHRNAHPRCVCGRKSGIIKMPFSPLAKAESGHLPHEQAKCQPFIVGHTSLSVLRLQYLGPHLGPHLLWWLSSSSKYALEPFTFVCSSTMSGAERRLSYKRAF
jgi:hypothetical protein